MFDLVPLSRYRRLVNSVLRLAGQRNFLPVSLNLEISVPAAKKSGLAPRLMKTVGDVLASNPAFKMLNSVLDRSWGRSRAVVFRELSFSIAVEKPFEGEAVVVIYVLKDIMTRSLSDLTTEYDRLADMPIEDFPLFRKMKPLLSVPDLLHGPLFALSAALFPRDYEAYGSMGFSNLGKGHVQCFFPLTSKTVILGLGGLREESGQTRLTLNLVFNHYVVDGRLCAEFLERIKEAFEGK